MIISLPEGSVDALSEGRRAFSEGRYAEALHHFSTILDHDPEHAWAWHGRGDALQLMGAHADALAAYTRAAALQPDEPLHRSGIDNAQQAMKA